VERSRLAALEADHRRLTAFLRPIVSAGIAAVEPGQLILQALDEQTKATLRAARTVSVVAAGKASATMWRSFLQHADVTVREAIVSAPGEPGCLPGPAIHFRASHPVPDDRSVAAGLAALDLAARVPEDGVLVVLLSGGASALLAAPAPGLTMGDKGAVTRLLLSRGCAIDGLNCVRRHLSRLKGGRLAACCRGHVFTLAISDVCVPVDDDPAVIGSGPTVPDPTTWADVLDVLIRHSCLDEVSPALRRIVDEGVRDGTDETPKPGDVRLARTEYRVIGSRAHAMEGARREAERLGFATAVIDRATTGEARVVAPRLMREMRRALEGRARPACAIASGETTVVVRGKGRGGRNQELVLAAAESLAGLPHPAAFASAGTDGVDGPTDAAGAVADSTTLSRAAQRGIDPSVALDANDSNRFFARLDDLILTGSTGTNVGVLQVLLLGSL